MTTCPTCGKTVDPLRARAVGVRDGKVVGYCSKECAAAAGAESKPTRMPEASPRSRTPPAGVPAKSGVPVKTAPVDSGPVIEILHEPASGVVTSARDARSDATPTPAKIASEKSAPARDDTTLGTWAVGDDEAVPDPDRSGVRISDFEERRKREGTPLPIAPRSKVPLILVAVLVLLGAGGYAVYRFLLAKPAASASAKREAPTPPPEVPIDAGPVARSTDRNAAVAQATAVLRANLASESPRVQRVAAAALARTRDAAAIDALATALAKEKIDVAKLDLAYALARAGDDRGKAALVAGLGSGRRDVKIYAGRLLAQLGDAKATQGLAGYLEVSQLRLGAAEQLAHLQDERAIKVLETIRADAKTSPDDRARATIALGIAGRTDVTPDLQALLQDARFNAFAASALAQLGDPTARAVLAEQLAIPSLRVEAARSLRRLDPTLDPAPLLADLVGALDSNKDTEQVQIAEAILLLAGDVTWSERM